MSAPQRVSSQQITDTLTRWRGNKAATARELGISEQCLRKRLLRLPIAAAMPRATGSRAVRLAAEDFERLREAGFDLAFVGREVWTADDVARAFVREAFPAWLERKLAALKAAK